ncbi:ABC-type phosphate transport system, permease component [Cenarchaeum symbiosum A]|uniref:Phosphate transport system permease protein n=1 Tax=Cenarchaeum symbiosum (strain A) TaxID=414004 RepID=A0RV42_CENSY|nr:ABC-type phosphate transport system, permease component [Cenarchaeum symbiosum A]
MRHSRHRPGGRAISDRLFRLGATIAGAYVLAVILVIFLQLGIESAPIWEKEGAAFIWGTDWNPVEGRDSFGALPYIVGTLLTAGIAMAIGVPLSIGIAMLVIIAPGKIGAPLGYLVELIEAVPSVIFGLWGLFVFRVYLRDWVEKPLHDMFGDSIFLFSGTPFGLDVLSASLILAIMIIPTISAVSREVMTAVPQQQKEAAYMLGSTTWEMFRMAVFPYSKAGLIGASVLGLGRAVGETMAVTMLIGNATGLRAIPESLFDPAQSMASIMANEFIEADLVFHVPALIGVALVLLLISMAINVGAHFLVSRMLHIRQEAVNS